jgi:hypothetical protein
MSKRRHNIFDKCLPLRQPMLLASMLYRATPPFGA